MEDPCSNLTLRSNALSDVHLIAKRNNPSGVFAYFTKGNRWWQDTRAPKRKVSFVMIQVWFTQNRTGITILYFFCSYVESPADHKMTFVFWICWRTKPLLFVNCLETRSRTLRKTSRCNKSCILKSLHGHFQFSLPKETNSKEICIYTYIYIIYIDRLIHPEKLTWNTAMEVCFDVSPPPPGHSNTTVAESAATGTGARPTARCPTAAGERSWKFQPGRSWPKTIKFGSWKWWKQIN